MAGADYPNLVFTVFFVFSVWTLLALLVTWAIYLGKGQAVIKLRFCRNLGQILN